MLHQTQHRQLYVPEDRLSYLARPVPVISVSPLSPKVCGGKSVLLTASGGKTYSWSPSNGLSATTGTNVSANPGSTTTYTVTGTDVNGCTGSTTVTVTIGTAPTITVNPITASVCNGQSVSLTANGGSTYSWGPSSGLSSTSRNTTTASPSSTTTYTVTGTDVNGCSSTATSTITISTSFAVNAGPDAHICTNGSTLITVTGAPGGSTYTWTPSTNLSCNNCPTPTASPVNTTTYIVKATSPAGCSGQDTITVVVTPLSAAAGPDTLVCSGNLVQLNASGGTNYSWTPSTGLSDSTIANPTVIPLATTTYTVTISSGNCSSTKTVTISTFPPLPTPSITQSGDTLTCSTNSQYTSYQWYFNSTLITGATNTTYIATQSGNYNVAVHDENGCFISVGINIILGLQNFSFDNTISLFPNPAGKELIIKNIELRIEKIEIYNVLGQKVYTEQPETRDKKQEINIDVSALSAGIYFLQLQQQQGKWIGRFVKE